MGSQYLGAINDYFDGLHDRVFSSDAVLGRTQWCCTKYGKTRVEKNAYCALNMRVHQPILLVKVNFEKTVSGIILTISIASTILFALVVLTKLGIPVIISVLLALAVGYFWWRFEREDNEKQGLADGICALLDVKDILKYVNKLF